MASPSVGGVLRIRGRLILNPTNITTPPAYGGTELGLVRDIRFRENIRVARAVSEAWGGQTIAAGFAGQAGILIAVMREWDTDLLQEVHPSAAVKATYNPSGVPDGRAPGTLLTNSTNTIMFAPTDVTNHPFFILDRAYGVIDEANEIQLSLAEEAGLAVVFEGIPRASDDRVHEYGLASDGVSL